MENRLTEILIAIDRDGALDKNAIEAAEARQKILAKPTGALGTLEDISIKMAGITGNVKNYVQKRGIVIMSADNGVVDEGVASAPQSVTLSQTINFTRHFTGVSAIAKHFGIDLLVVDMGVKLPIPQRLYADSPVDGDKVTDKIWNKSLGKGTRNLAKEPAMTRSQALEAILTGIDAVAAFKSCNYDLFGIGEMGIGNTTTSACVLSALTGATGEDVVGRGGGLNDQGLAKKVHIVNKAAASCKGDEVIDILATVGGFDICAMTGAFLGAAYYRLPVVVDGYISAVAALAATKLAPNVFNFLFGSHLSKEQGYKIAVDEIGISPYFDLGMRLGEGSGCPISFNIIETACAAMNEMATFEEGAINADYLEEGEKGNFF